MTELNAKKSVSQFDEVTDTKFLGKTDRNTFVFTGLASNVCIIHALSYLLVGSLNIFIF